LFNRIDLAAREVIEGDLFVDLPKLDLNGHILKVSGDVIFDKGSSGTLSLLWS